MFTSQNQQEFIFVQLVSSKNKDTTLKIEILDDNCWCLGARGAWAKAETPCPTRVTFEIENETWHQKQKMN